MFITLLDYYPESFCQSGHPEQELQLRAGDVVNVIGKMNSDGYYYVQFNDRQGLVPANFLEEMKIKDPAIKQRLRNQVQTLHSVRLTFENMFISVFQGIQGIPQAQMEIQGVPQSTVEI